MGKNMNKEEKTLKENLIYDGRIIKVYNDEVLCPNGNKAHREYIKHNGGVCILALKDGYIYFEKQFRYPYHEEVLELPAGKLELNEDPLEAAKRELKEEIGFTSLNMEYIGYFYPSVGYTNEIIRLYFSSENELGDTNPDEDELIEIVKLSVKEAYEMLDRGEIADAKTVILLSKLKERLLK